MAAVPLSQAPIPKTMGQMVWVCGTAVAWPGTGENLSLKNKDLALISGTARGTVRPIFGAFQVSQPSKIFRRLGHPEISQTTGAKRAATFALVGSRARPREVVRGTDS